MTAQVSTNAVETGTTPPGWPKWHILPLVIGMLLLVVPTLKSIADVSWSTEQGAHGPIVLAIAIWLFVRRWPDIRAHAEPGKALIGWTALVVMLICYLMTNIVGSVSLQSVAVYGALIATLYLLVGWNGIRQAWFPILYFIFVLPLPGSVVATLTQPLRLEISSRSVSLLRFFGYPVADSGLTIFIDQYALEVKAACGGLNSIISLSAIGLFYAYIRHHAHAAYLAAFSIVIIAMAVLANFVRVILLVLITYYLGNEAAQGFLHQFAGMVMFVVALAGTMAFDSAIEWVRHRRAAR